MSFDDHKDLRSIDVLSSKPPEPVGVDLAGKLIFQEKLTIAELLIQRAGLTSEILAAGKTDQDFGDILIAMEQIHKGKEALYGNYLETHGKDPTNFALMEHFADIKRKFVRADGFVKKRLSGVNLDLKEMLDTYSDIAVYGAIGVQLILHLMEREQNEQK